MSHHFPPGVSDTTCSKANPTGCLLQGLKVDSPVQTFECVSLVCLQAEPHHQISRRIFEQLYGVRGFFAVICDDIRGHETVSLQSSKVPQSAN